MRISKRCTLLWLMARGIPLSFCVEYTEDRIKTIEEEEGEKRRAGQNVKQAYLNKEPKEIARLLLNACAQYAVAERLAEEWELLGSEIRMKFTDLANAGRRSGNKTKGLLRADKFLGGRILRRQHVERTVYEEFHAVRRGDDSSQIALKFAALPKDYKSWSPARKKQYREQIARERRAT